MSIMTRDSTQDPLEVGPRTQLAGPLWDRPEPGNSGFWVGGGGRN